MNELWTRDLFYSTSIPLINNAQNTPNVERYVMTYETPDSVMRANRRTPLSNLTESPDGLLVMQPAENVRRRLDFTSDTL